MRYYAYIIIIIISFVILLYVQSALDNKRVVQLSENGKTTNAEIYNISINKMQSYYYRFCIRDSIYYGFYSIGKKYDNVFLFDSIKIHYLNENPNINIPSYVIDEL